MDPGIFLPPSGPTLLNLWYEESSNKLVMTVVNSENVYISHCPRNLQMPSNLLGYVEKNHGRGFPKFDRKPQNLCYISIMSVKLTEAFLYYQHLIIILKEKLNYLSVFFFEYVKLLSYEQVNNHRISSQICRKNIEMKLSFF